MQDVKKDRHRYIGGSDVPILMETEHFGKSVFDLAREKAGLIEDDFKGNKYTDFGNSLEPKIRDYVNEHLELMYNFNFEEHKKIDEDNKIRGHFDGWDEELKSLLEIKTSSSLSKNFKYWNYQMQLYMYLAGVSNCHLAFYKRPEDFSTIFNSENLEIDLIERDDELISSILERCKKFWEVVAELKKNPFATDEELTKVYIGKGQTEIINFHISKIEKMEKAIFQMKELEKKIKEEKEKLLNFMIEKDIKKFDNEKFSITKKSGGEKKTLNKEVVEDFIMIKNDTDLVGEEFYKISKIKESLLIKKRRNK